MPELRQPRVVPAPPRGRAGGALADRLIRLIGVLLLLSALALGLFRAPDRSVESLVARWAPPPSDFIDLGGQLVHVRDEGPRGDALPIVLLHGMGLSLHTWEGWSAALRTQRRVITLDLPGFGLTGPSAAADYGADSDAAFVLAVLDLLRVQRFVVGGQGLGGEVAWRLAAGAPQRAAQLILVAASGYAVAPAELPPVLLLARQPVIGPAAARLGEFLLPQSLVQATVTQMVGDPQRLSPLLVDRCFELLMREGNRRALTQRLQRLQQPQNQQPDMDAGRIATLRLPTLILWGGRDRLIPPAAADRFARDIPGSQLLRFEALGHWPQEEDAAATVLPVKRFLGLH